jgi:Protein of unknown function (DUF3606)
MRLRDAKDFRSRSHIEMDDEAAVRSWIKRLKITKDELQCAVDKVGNSVVAVRKQICPRK